MTLDCLTALYTDLGSLPAEVFVVDNASSDGSVDAVRAAFPQVKVIENPKNAGFGAANNQALSQATGEYLLLLNSDAFPRPGAIAALIDCLRSNPRAAAVGPRLLNKDGTLQRSCYKFPSPARAWLENLWMSALLPQHPLIGDYQQWAHDEERVVDFVIGACMLVRREAYVDVGGFDEGFFMYAEETDWQRRMADQGWQVHFTPTAEVVHFGGASGAAEKARINRHFFDSLDRYEHKHHGMAGLVSLRLAMLVGSALRVLLWLCVLVFMPKRRAAARAKARLLSWLCVRQATHWPQAGKNGAAA